MAKYTFDICFDIPSDVLKTIPVGNELSVIKSNYVIDRFTPAKSEDDYSIVRLSVEGGDGWCQRAGRSLTLTIGKNKYKSCGVEIIHCQG